MSRSSGPEGRRSAKDQMAAHRPAEEPVLLAAESQQLVAMTPLMVPDFVIQNKFWLHRGIPDIDNCLVKFFVLEEVGFVDQMSALFHGANPNILVVDEVDGEGFAVFAEYINKIFAATHHARSP